MIKYLFTKDAGGKFRYAVIECFEEWNPLAKGFVIQKSYGTVRGKNILSPAIIIDRPKQKRTWVEQYTLQFNSEVKKFLDKGYIEVEKHPNDIPDEELNNIYGDVKTNQYGVIKPMLAKQYDKVTNKKIFDNKWLCSRKIDGLRNLMYWDGSEIHTSSRGGTHYDYSTKHLRENPTLIDFFKNNPTVILDGELYKHGKTLQQISGAARMEKNAYDCEWLELIVYDMYNKANPEMTAEERYDFLYNNFNFPIYLFESDSDEDIDKIKNSPIWLLHQIEVEGEKNIWKWHDTFVSEGFEGCVIRNPDKPYKPGGRTNDMIKFKRYKSKEFKVIGYNLGLRGSEDMTFTCELDDGRTFEAMPVGNREVKAEYVENFEDKYKGHLAECTYFNLSDDGVPTQPKMRIFRFDLE